MDRKFQSGIASQKGSGPGDCTFLGITTGFTELRNLQIWIYLAKDNRVADPALTRISQLGSKALSRVAPFAGMRRPFRHARQVKDMASVKFRKFNRCETQH
jgi:hypothetical protein